MARKRFIDTAAPEPDEIPSRTDAKKQRVRHEEELMALAQALVALKDKSLEKLSLSESVLEAVWKARAITAAAARYRALRVVRAVLRDVDLVTLRRALDNLHER